MSTAADNRETLAIRRALAAFSETLDRELRGLVLEDLDELDGTRHGHGSLLLTNGKPIAVIVTLEFTADPNVIADMVKRAKRKGHT